MPFIVGEVAATIGADQSGFNRALSSVYRKGARIEQLGSKMTRWLTLPFIGASAAVFKFGSDFEAELSKIEGLVGISRDQINAWEGDLQDMAGEVGKAPEELARGLFFVTSAGFEGAAAMDVLEQSAKASAAGLGEVATIADAVTSAVNAYGKENLDATQATDTLVAAVREGKLEASQLAPVLGRLLPTASALGVGFDQVAGILAAFSRTGQDAAEGATSLNAILTLLARKAGPQAQRVLDDYNLSMERLRDMAAGPEGVVGVMRLLDERFGDNEEALSTLVPNVRAFRGFMNILAQDASVVDDVLMGVADSANSGARAFEAAEKTGRQKLNKLFAELKSTATELYEDGIRVLSGGLDDLRLQIQSFRKAWANMSDDAKAKIMGLVGMLVVGGPLLMAMGKAMQMISSLASAVFSPIGAVAAGVGLVVVAGQNLIDNWAIVESEFKQIWLGMEMQALGAARRIVQAAKLAAIGPSRIALAGTEEVLKSMIATTKEQIDTEQRFQKIMGTTSFLESAENAWNNLKSTVSGFMGMAYEGSEIQKLINEMQSQLAAGKVSEAMEDATGATDSWTQSLKKLGFAGKRGLPKDTDELALNMERAEGGMVGYKNAAMLAMGITENMTKSWDDIKARIQSATTLILESFGSAFAQSFFKKPFRTEAELELQLFNLDQREQELQESLARQLISQKEFNLRVAAMHRQRVNIENQLDAARTKFFKRMLSNMVSAVKNAVKQIIQEFAKLALFKGIGAIFGLGGITGAADLAGGLLKKIGFKAGGGQVRAGSSYIVGEQGPELFQPSASGAIIPNGRFSMGAGVNNAMLARIERHLANLHFGITSEELYLTTQRGKRRY